MSLFRLTAILLTVFTFHKGKAQNGIELGARSMGMGNANSATSDSWSVFNNPSGIANRKNPEALFAVKKQYGVNALNSIGAGIVVPIKLGALAVSTFRFGDDLFYQQYVSALYANKFGIGQLGFRINYFETFIEGFGNKTQLTLDFGGIVELGESLSVGAMVRNITRSELSDFEDERLPTLLSIGLMYAPDDKFVINVDVEKDIEFDPRLKLGLEYQFLPKFNFRTGVNTAPFNNFLGLGFRTWKVVIDYAIAMDYTLGTSHQATLSYKLSKK